MSIFTKIWMPVSSPVGNVFTPGIAHINPKFECLRNEESSVLVGNIWYDIGISQYVPGCEKIFTDLFESSHIDQRPTNIPFIAKTMYTPGKQKLKLVFRLLGQHYRIFFRN